MRYRARLVALLLLTACETSVAPPPSASPGVTARATAGSVAASPSAEPSALLSMRPGIRATAAGTIPDQFRYVPVESPLLDGYHTRLWLVDLTGKRAPAVVAEWDAPASPVGGYTASADGRTLLVSAAGSRSRVALYTLRAESGETAVLFEDPSTIVISPRISADGTAYAYTRYPAAGGMDLGIWAGKVTAPGERRISEPSTESSVPQMPLAWSPDDAWLAFTRDLEQTDVRLVRADGGDEVRIGLGDKVSWRKTAPELLVAESVAPSSRIYTVDIATGKATDLFRLDKLFVPVIAWHPVGDRFVYVASENATREASGGIWLWSTGLVPPLRLDTGRTLFAPEWSRDGTLLSALAGGDDVRIPIVDLVTGRQLSVLCRRGGTPPANCA